MTSYEKIKQEIESNIKVSRQDIALAKDYVLKSFNPNPESLLKKFIEALKVNPVEYVNPEDEVALERQIKEAAAHMSWILAFGEAIWGLIGQGVLIPEHYNLIPLQVSLGHKSSRGSGGLGVEGYQILVPQSLRLAPSVAQERKTSLYDPDLFIFDINIPNLHTEIEESIRLAVQCFRKELLLPCLAMLARASEGAWIEMGRALLDSNYAQQNINDKKRLKKRNQLLGRDTSITLKMDIVIKLYERPIFTQVHNMSSPAKFLRKVLIWSQELRDYRNAIHYERDSTSRITYDKVATLLLAAGSNIRTLYDIRNSMTES